MLVQIYTMLSAFVKDLNFDSLLENEYPNMVYLPEKNKLIILSEERTKPCFMCYTHNRG